MKYKGLIKDNVIDECIYDFFYLSLHRALEDFKAYLEDEYGTQSKEYVAFELWMSILVHDKMPKGRRNRHARKLFQYVMTSIDL